MDKKVFKWCLRSSIWVSISGSSIAFCEARGVYRGEDLAAPLKRTEGFLGFLLGTKGKLQESLVELFHFVDMTRFYFTK